MIGEKPTYRTRLSVLKLRSNHVEVLRSLVPDVFSFHVHWLGGRSLMCPGDDCPACFQGVGAKWLGLLYCQRFDLQQRKLQYGLVEFTELAFNKLSSLRDACGREDLSGWVFTAHRKSRRSPLSFALPDCEEIVPPSWSAFDETRVADGVATLYGLPSLAPGESLSEWEARARDAARAMLSRCLAHLGGVVVSSGGDCQ